MRTSLQLDKDTRDKLSILAEIENRTKVDEIRFMIKKEMDRLHIHQKQKKIVPTKGVK